jgi:hypothetical protein
MHANGVYSPIHGIFERTGRIRIAIIDTGAELPEEALDSYGNRLAGHKSWLTPTDKDKDLGRGDKDMDGHGTHATGLLLRLAPDAEVYVARVFKKRREAEGLAAAEDLHNRIAGVGVL